MYFNKCNDFTEHILYTRARWHVFACQLPLSTCKVKMEIMMCITNSQRFYKLYIKLKHMHANIPLTSPTYMVPIFIKHSNMLALIRSGTQQRLSYAYIQTNEATALGFLCSPEGSYLSLPCHLTIFHCFRRRSLRRGFHLPLQPATPTRLLRIPTLHQNR